MESIRKFTLKHKNPVFLSLTLLFALILVLQCATGEAKGVVRSDDLRAKELFENAPIYFVENNGQMDSRVLFYQKGRGYRTYFTESGIYFEVVSRDVTQRIKLYAVDGNPAPEIVGASVLPGKVNYFIGSDPQGWRSDIPTYGSILYKDVYPGIDLKFYGKGQTVVYDVIVKSGGDPSKVRFGFEGIQGLDLTSQGELLVELGREHLTQRKLHVYQQTASGDKKIDATFAIQETGERFVYGFDIASYDPKAPLVIDPALEFSTYLGGDGDDRALDLAAEVDTNVLFLYVTGWTVSTDFDVKVGSFDTTANGGRDAFVTKFNTSVACAVSDDPTCAQLVYSTYLGGAGEDQGMGIAIDASDSAYVTGYAQLSSPNFPTTVGPAHAGSRDVFVTKLNSTGSALTYSRFIGGCSEERGFDIAVDADGEAYVTGWTNSQGCSAGTGYPIVLGANLAGTGMDVFASKVSTDGTTLVYSSVIGGSGDEQAFGIAVQPTGQAHITGWSLSLDYDLLDAFDTTHNGGKDAIVTSFTLTGTLEYSTYIGGSGIDVGGGDDTNVVNTDGGGGGIATNADGLLCVSGESLDASTDFPTTIPGNVHSGGRDAFVIKINPYLTGVPTLLWSRLFGSDVDESSYDVTYQDAGGCCFSGFTQAQASDGFPVVNPIQADTAGDDDMFIASISSDGLTILFSTFLGGSADDHAFGIVSLGDRCCVSGQTQSDDFPTSTGAYSTVYDNNFDGCVTCVSGVPTEVKLHSFKAIEDGGAIYLRWKTGREVDNLGFNIYKEERGRRQKLNDSFIAGSALMASTILTAGNSYSWLDAAPSKTGRSRYWLESISLQGERTMHGPVEAESSLSKPLNAYEKRQAALLKDVGKAQKARQEEVIVDSVEFSAEADSFSSRSKSTRNSGVELAAASAPSSPVQQSLAAGVAVKILVSKPGWYLVSRNALVNAGIPSTVDPRYLQLYLNGVEQSIIVNGQGDKRFDTADSIEFYGTGLDSRYSGSRVYWLRKGTVLGKRIGAATGKGTAVAPASFPITLERKDKTFYFAGLRNGEADNFFGGIVMSAPLEQTLSLHHVATGAATATLTVTLQGATTVRHNVEIRLNGTPLGTAMFFGQRNFASTYSVAQNLLREGANTVTLTPLGGELDATVVDSIRITYNHTYRADSNSLRFTVLGGQQLTVGGFTSNTIKVVDLTNAAAPSKVTASVISQSGTFGVTIKVPGSGARTLFAYVSPLAADSLVTNQPSQLYSSAGSKMIILAHKNFVGGVTSLRNLRQSQGHSVGVVNIEDVYDEFSFGHKTPQAIRDFLSHAKSNWATKPQFLTLVGDASFDPRNYLGAGDFDFVPTKQVDTRYLETASDDWFTDFNEDGIADISTGRIPARTLTETNTMISKIVSYDQSPAGGWKNEILFVSDINDDVFKFEAASDRVQALVPSSKTSKQVKVGQTDPATARATLLNEINNGKLLVNYFGHASVEFWANDLLSSDDASTLNNGNRLPFFVNMNCLNGFFQDLYAEPLAEALLKTGNGGAVAVWASSSLTTPGVHDSMDQTLFNQLFNGQGVSIGDAVRAAKQSIRDMDVRRSWILFGDPATKLQ